MAKRLPRIRLTAPRSGYRVLELAHRPPGPPAAMSPRDGDTDVRDASWTDSSAWRARRRGATTFEHRPLVASPTARLGRHAPALGAHTRRVLAELGNGQAEAGRRLSARAVRAAE